MCICIPAVDVVDRRDARQLRVQRVGPICGCVRLCAVDRVRARTDRLARRVEPCLCSRPVEHHRRPGQLVRQHQHALVRHPRSQRVRDDLAADRGDDTSGCRARDPAAEQVDCHRRFEIASIGVGHARELGAVIVISEWESRVRRI